MSSCAPTCDTDLFSEATAAHPYELYRALRSLGPVVHFTTHDFLALTRYRDARAALRLRQSR